MLAQLKMPTAQAVAPVSNLKPLRPPEIPDRHAAQSALLDTARSVIEQRNKVEALEDAFFVADLSIVRGQFLKWKKLLPDIHPHYAVKCNSSVEVLLQLADMGAAFDCASQQEIVQVLDLGIEPHRIIYANTVKTPSYLRYAKRHGVSRMTFDNVDELYKIHRYYPEAELLLRIITDDRDALCQLSCKFGAPMETVPELLNIAKKLGLNVIGVAFHIGSGGGAYNAYPKALKDSRVVFDLAADVGIQLRVLDIGGGFETPTFPKAASIIKASIAELNFPAGIEIIAEPGRFMVADAFTLVTNVIGRRWTDKASGRGMLYVNDGVYGNLNVVIFDHQKPIPKLLYLRPSESDRPMVASIWGPTCDGLDHVLDEVTFPRAVEIGEWVHFDRMGAYSLVAATTFNGFNGQCEIHYVGHSAKTEFVP